MRRFLLYQGPLILWSILIFWLSSISRIPSIPWTFHPDKFAHLFVYGILGLAAHRAFVNQDGLKTLRVYPFSASVVFATLYGLSDEFHQRFVPGRTFEVYDLLTDILGAVLAIALLMRWNRSRQKPNVH